MSTEKNLYASRNKKKPKQDGDMRTLVFLQLPGSEQLDLRLAALSSLSLAPWARLHSWLAGNMIQFSQSQPHRAFLASSGQSRLAQGRRATRLELEVCSSIFKIGTWLPRPTPLMLTGWERRKHYKWQYVDTGNTKHDGPGNMVPMKPCHNELKKVTDICFGGAAASV